jgi:hypothetical protein
MFNLDPVDDKADEMIPANQDKQFKEVDGCPIGGEPLPERVRDRRRLM